MDYVAWHRQVASRLGHGDTLPWHEPSRLSEPLRAAVGRLAWQSAWVAGLGAAWYEHLARRATHPAEAEAIRLMAATGLGHGQILHRLAQNLLDRPRVWIAPTTLSLPTLVSLDDQLVVLHGAEILARAWTRTIVDAVRHDPLTSSVFAMLLYERAALVTFSRLHLAEIGRQNTLARARVRLTHVTTIPVLVTSAWMTGGRDLQQLTRWDWSTYIRTCHGAYEHAYAGDLSYLRQGRLVQALSWG